MHETDVLECFKSSYEENPDVGLTAVRLTQSDDTRMPTVISTTAGK